MQSNTRAKREVASFAAGALESGARFGYSVRDCEDGTEILAGDSSLFFPAASTTKLLTCAVALSVLGAKHILHTKLVARGSVHRDGTLAGDIVLVAAGDASFSTESLRTLAARALRKGIRRVTGSAVIDVSLFDKRTTAMGTLVAPFILDDNCDERFGMDAFNSALREAGVHVDGGTMPRSMDESVIAEHESQPLIADITRILKFSDNLHADVLLDVLGAEGLRARGKDAYAAAFRLIREFLQAGDLAIDQVIQNEGSGNGIFTPAFLTDFLRYVHHKPFAEDFKRSLPVLGQGGTLRTIQKGSPAAGHVFAKTGTIHVKNELAGSGLLIAKTLAGYVQARSGRTLAFAFFANNVPFTNEEEIEGAGERLGRAATAVYLHL